MAGLDNVFEGFIRCDYVRTFEIFNLSSLKNLKRFDIFNKFSTDLNLPNIVDFKVTRNIFEK